MWRLTRPDAAAILENPRVKRSLPRYVDIVKNRKQAKFVIAKSMAVDYDQNAPTEALWKVHEEALKEFSSYEQELDRGGSPDRVLGGERSFLDLKVDLARRVMSGCVFCVRRCGADRLSGERGYCRGGVDFSVSSTFPHMGEEPELVPSGTVFTCGCTITCIHCQNWGISQWRERGTPVKADRMADLVGSLRRQGCRNLNMVGGDPTPNTYLWLDTFRHVNESIATVWNSNSYYSQETADLLAGFIDLYLLDFKYGNDECSSAISNAPGYWEACTRNHTMAKMYGELIIRVLVLPGHNECCTRPILQWIAENLGTWTRVNLMFQYRPEWRARERTELRQRLSRDQIREALMIADEAGLKNLVR
jgi:putative pyruvate formate lyase activating enzyme